jgi:signal transduction histidine kinase
MTLHETLAAHRDAVILRWKLHVRGESSLEAIPSLELVDHIPQFLDEIVDALRADAGLPVADRPQGGHSAAVHGAQRLRLGFSLSAVVGEYGSLRDAIVYTAKEAGAPVNFRELQVLFECTVAGIADAVSEYSRQRDAELLRQANEHFAFVAHELRNPLASASAALLSLKLKAQLPGESRSTTALERGLRRAVDLIDETLQIARIASGIEIRRRPVTLRALFEDAELEAMPQAEAKGVEIAVAIQNDRGLSLDARLVGSALGNLLRNAVKFTSTGSKVELRGVISADRVRIEVEDCCGGLPPGKVEEVFAPFVRLDKQQDGFGLGLAIAKQAVEAHGGSIRVQSLPGKGCVFALELPVPIDGEAR